MEQTVIDAAQADERLVALAGAAMREKLAKKRLDGRSGWERCPIKMLNAMLIDHIAKGDPVDVMNIAAMIHALGGSTSLTDHDAKVSAEAVKDLAFPVRLRKTWSGEEVQACLGEQVARLCSLRQEGA